MYYRRKILLATLEAFGGSVNSLKFQKYLFLIMERLSKKYYHFVPYKYGCFSFESYRDKRSLKNYLREDENKWTLKHFKDNGIMKHTQLQNTKIPPITDNQKSINENYQFLYNIFQEDKNQILIVKKRYEKLSKEELLNKIYSRYPYYAINSEIISEACLSNQEKKKIESNKPKQDEKCLFTIGYEGRSIDEYLNILIKNNIKILCDVRKNPLSRKYGFSKYSLKKNTQNLGIEYVHIPELGINSDLRKSLNSKKDYEQLFSLYKKTVLPNRKTDLETIINLMKNKKRIALTCFESDPNMCHRNCISSNLKKKNSETKIKHL